MLQSAQSAKAEHQAQALVLSCIDFCFLESLSFLAQKNLSNQYDWTLAGAFALAGFPHPADTIAFWDQLDLSYRLHHIHKVIILDHQDGAYASIIDRDSSSDSRELQIHADYLNRADWVIRDPYPDLNIELCFFTLSGSVKAVFPLEQS